MTSDELFDLCLDHFSRSQWDPFYAQAEVDERWYTSEMATALLRQGAYPYPRYRFGSEESFNTLAAIVGGPPLAHIAAKKIPDLTLVQFEPSTELVFIVEAKVVRSVYSTNVSMKPGALGAQMKQAKEMFPSATIYGFIAAELSPTFGQFSVPERLAVEIEPYLPQLSSGARDRLEQLIAKWTKAGNRTNPNVLRSDFGSFAATIIGPTDPDVLSNVALHVTDALGRFKDLEEQDGLTCEQIDGPQGKALIADLEGECSRLWMGHGNWISGGILGVPNKTALTVPGNAAAVAGLAVGLWEWKDGV